VCVCERGGGGRLLVLEQDIAGEEITGTVFVRNLPTDLTRPELVEVLTKFGPISSCRLVLDKFTRMPIGNAFVDFEQSDDAKKAARISRGKPGVLFRGKPITVKMALTQTGLHAISTGNTARSQGKPKYVPKKKKNRGLKRKGKAGRRMIQQEEASADQ
jgi:nucleolar protein 4